MSIDTFQQSTVATLQVVASRTASANGSGFDVSGYEGRGYVGVIHAQDASANTLNARVEHSTDNSTFTAVSGYTMTQATSSSGLARIEVDTDAVNQYIRSRVMVGSANQTGRIIGTYWEGIKKYQ